MQPSIIFIQLSRLTFTFQYLIKKGSVARHASRSLHNGTVFISTRVWKRRMRMAHGRKDIVDMIL
jgi:hypothetical protein